MNCSIDLSSARPSPPSFPPSLVSFLHPSFPSALVAAAVADVVFIVDAAAAAVNRGLSNGPVHRHHLLKLPDSFLV